MIDANSVSFLCELLDEIGRKDLTDEVKAYIERMEGVSADIMRNETAGMNRIYVCHIYPRHTYIFSLAQVVSSSPYVQELDTLTLKTIANEVSRSI